MNYGEYLVDDEFIIPHILMWGFAFHDLGRTSSFYLILSLQNAIITQNLRVDMKLNLYEGAKRVLIIIFFVGYVIFATWFSFENASAPEKYGGGLHPIALIFLFFPIGFIYGYKEAPAITSSIVIILVSAYVFFSLKWIIAGFKGQ